MTDINMLSPTESRKTIREEDQRRQHGEHKQHYEQEKRQDLQYEKQHYGKQHLDHNKCQQHENQQQNTREDEQHTKMETRKCYYREYPELQQQDKQKSQNGGPTAQQTQYQQTAKKSKESFSKHIHMVCENLIKSASFDRLEHFLRTIPQSEDYRNLEIVLVAQTYIAFRNGEFEKLYDLLQKRTYSKRYHRQLQHLWRTARYNEAEKSRGRLLGSVGKYRIRRKFPLPSTIWDGEYMSYCFREEAREILNKAYKTSPYPTSMEKYELAQETNLSVIQVSNWFKNKRQRARSKRTEMEKNERTLRIEEAKKETQRPDPQKKLFETNEIIEYQRTNHTTKYVVPEIETETLPLLKPVPIMKVRNTKFIEKVPHTRYVPRIPYYYTHPLIKTPFALSTYSKPYPTVKVPYTQLYSPYARPAYEVYRPIPYKEIVPPPLPFKREKLYNTSPYVIAKKTNKDCTCCCGLEKLSKEQKLLES